MRKLALLGLILILALTGGVFAQGGGADPAHLVLVVAGGGDARINRMDWDVNAFAPVFPGTGVRSSDYIDLSGRTTLTILCADLTLVDQRGSEVPSCEPYPNDPAFFFVDDPEWAMAEAVSAVVTMPGSQPPAEVDDPGAFSLNEMTGGNLDTVTAQAQTIRDLGLADDAQAYALASLYRSYDAYFEALGGLTALPDLECLERRPTVNAPQGEARPLAQSPVLYLRIGELYEILGQREDALRNYQCAATLAEAISDSADAALAFARWANIVPDPAQAVTFYQNAINYYAALGAMDNANILLEICGLRSCALP